MKIDIPEFNFSIDTSVGNLSFNHKNIYPQPFIYEDSFGNMLIILGRPHIKGKSLKEEIKEIFISQSNFEQPFLQNIDGEFLILIFNKNSYKFSIVSDRFSSIPLYYFVDDQTFYGSNNYADLIQLASKNKNFKLQKNNFFEFLWFRRLHNNITYDSLIKAMMPGRVLKFQGGLVYEKEYWKPSFRKNNFTLSQSTEALRNAILGAVKQKIDLIGNKNFGLFLSGGMDTRTILAAFHALNTELPECYTLGYTPSGEFRIAKQLTDFTGARHHFLKMSPNTYDQFWSEKSRLAGGMHHQLQNIFIGLKNQSLSSTSVFFHGHGFDYLFQGMYLPASPLRIFNKNLHLKKINNLHNVGNFSKFYSENVPYRAWRVNLQEYLLPKYKDELMNHLYENIQSIEDQGREVCNDNFDLWEYMMIHSLSRHYSQTDIMGMGTYGEQIKVANDNTLFNTYLSMPINHRKYARAMRGALREMSPELANIHSANTGNRISAGPIENSFLFAYRKVLRAFSSSIKYQNPTADRRTWPNEDDQVRRMKLLNNAVSSLHQSDHLREALPYLDFNLLQSKTDDWLEHGRPGGGQFLMCLLSIDSFLKSF
tara:strand:+ start:3175 stop:4959 length:1785 start_codon:yes stop_codon:yes gene_type:complete